MIAYRKEIDGLRALAVLPVILFHAGFHAFSGGFVGVDVFFVISGFLITSIIVSDLDRGTFSLVTFYERRARRIVPALFLVLLTCAVFAWLWLLPNDLRAFAKSFASVPVFASNVVFGRESGYFDSAAELKVLLHTWSLAVEEQYYLLFPVFMIGCWRIGKRWVMPALLVVLVASFALAQRASMTNPDAAFFWLPMRAWELMVGAATAVWLANTARPLPHAVREMAGWGGLALILGAVVSYDHTTPFPGVYALLPTIGTALIIACTTQGTTLGALLGHRVVVAIGLVSYSAYLWHQPVLALARYRVGPSISDAIRMLLCVMVFGLAYLTWKYVEAPFRNRSRISRRSIFRMNLIGGAIFVAIGVWGYQTDGFLNRAKWDTIRDAQITAREKASGFRYCGDHRVTSSLTTFPVCLIGDTTQAPEGVLWGDSYAGSLLVGMHEQLVNAKRSYYAVLSDGCTPIAGGSKPSYGCTDARQRQFFANFLRTPGLRRLIWVGRFEAVIGQAVDSTFVLDTRPSSPAGFRARLLEMAAQLRGANKEVVFVATTPSFPESVPGRVTRLFLARGDTASSVQRIRTDVMRQRLGSDAPFLAAMQQQVRVLDGLDVLCSSEVCASHDAAGHLLYVDDGHISHVASRKLATAVLQTVDRTP